ncbi:hypothetical protein DSM106972_095930 [Dulcicalothrix desertica PCC 7102]|uniref:DUF1822 domain-containing protein n=1 Tax=Dulcicalothrix desertica PCC 7102 TaxID=232991 RepID=A0A433UI96_9CYAN|nr:DUF1822 family protein [Dulcicalothrix desertica]RUS93603.1 hypothetical protein DSM106972_095930 [Dulcicalothrix desertica PCC 7102]TWH54954.1 uncharacterized protein DUF1822 [Dulcicalothrix desertica PCC 7102]
MNYTNETLHFQVSLTAQAFHFARQLSGKQKDLDKSRQVYLNTLAVYAVNFYCQYLEVETDLEHSDSWNSLSHLLLDAADLEITGVGKLECRPVLPGAKTVKIPPSVWNERIGYVVVEIDESSKSATLLGFVKEVITEELPLSKLQSLADLIEHLQPVAEVSPNPSVIEQTVVHLGQWLQNLFTSDWQSPDLVLSPAYRSAIRPKVQEPNSQEVSVSGAKVIDLGIQLSSHKVALVIQLTTQASGSVDIRLRVYPTGDSIYLPQGLQLIVLSSDGNLISENFARSADNWMQLELEEGRPGDEFQVKLALEDVSIIENFIL